MALKKYNPITNGQRHRITLLKTELSKSKPVKQLTMGLTKKSGRNNFGRITSLNKGGGHKRKYRFIDFKRQLYNDKATVMSLEYDPNRSAHIALIQYESGALSYILAPENLKVGDKVESIFKIDSNSINIDHSSHIGTSLPLFLVPKGTIIHNIELKPGKGGQLARSAGTFGKLIEKYKNGYASVELNSGTIRLIPLHSIVTLGSVSNKEHENIVYGKAGAKRWLNVKPHVRGVAMNPIDHPHGGGEGKSKGRPSVSKWGKITKGKKTRNNKLTNKYIVKRRK
jgi:large subunit ribosomal protein L2|uniref:Ribosomal protein L2 n=1 Tax=Thecamonas trahens TaxID=529818 RepID=A0A0B5H4N9_THETB|nr:ribosomal protein L2 [Thecamonas trahens]AJF36629.1 ribosomal protein L2 [Thecamonas trahens]